MPPELASHGSAAPRPVRRDEYRKVAECLGRAFYDDPLAMHFFPDDATRLRRYVDFTQFVMGMFESHGRFVTSDPLHGGALWQAPSPPRGGVLSSLATGLRMAWVAGSSFGRIASMGQTTLRHHPSAPHWYLAMLGTEPEAQGRGIGSALMKSTLEECDREGTLAYLESSKESNVPFYERHGFRVDCEIRPPGCPSLWAMTRRPA